MNFYFLYSKTKTKKRYTMRSLALALETKYRLVLLDSISRHFEAAFKNYSEPCSIQRRQLSDSLKMTEHELNWEFWVGVDAEAGVEVDAQCGACGCFNRTKIVVAIKEEAVVIAVVTVVVVSLTAPANACQQRFI